MSCKICDNLGGWQVQKQIGGETYPFWVECICSKKKRYIEKAKSLGLGEDILEKTFDTYKTPEKWQENILTTAKKFIESGKTFYIGGQVGSGKTHICTAILNCLIEKELECSYMVWNDIVTRLKQTTYGDEKQYNEYLNELKTISVLYIDDFFKITPSTADIDKAFQFINARYIASKNNKLITLFSSEKTFNELSQSDEAIASRIYEMANKGEFILSIQKDTNKNFRYKQ